jgi:adenylosuccinate synthase
VLGGQAGSEGKGKVAGLLAHDERPDIAVCAFSANAGHTAIHPDGRKVVVHQVPIGCSYNNVRGLIGPGAAIYLPRLLREIEELGLSPERLGIDSRAMIITEEDREEERVLLGPISSTIQGVGAAYIRRIRRNADTTLARNTDELLPYIVDVKTELAVAYSHGARIQVEGSQGYDLDILHGLDYPHCTSRSVTLAAVANDCGMPVGLIDRSVLVFRTYPIRVGNVFDPTGTIMTGWSGPIPEDSQELDWNTITQLSGSKTPLCEMTTVTGKVRRIYTWSRRRYIESVWMNDATDLFITFADYLDASLHGQNEASAAQWDALVEWLRAKTTLGDVPVGRFPVLLGFGTGPCHDGVLRMPKEVSVG